MSQAKYQIIVSGQIIDGFDLDTVKANVAKLFKSDVSKVEPLFSGQPVVVKKDLDEGGAKKYMLALKQAGLVSKGRPMAAAPAEQPEAKPSTPEATPEVAKEPTPPAGNVAPAANRNPSGDIGADIAPVGETMDQTPPPPPAEINTDGIAMGFVGEDLAEHQHIPEPDIDTSAYTTEEVGADLDRTPPPAEPDINISQMGMDEVGVDIDNTPRPEEPTIDISGMSMAEAGETIMTHPEVPPAKIDTSKLDFAGDK